MRDFLSAFAVAVSMCASGLAGDGLAHVEKRGAGPVQMVLIPGLACDWTVYEAFMARNGERYTMHAATLAGFGGSEAPAAPEEGTKFGDSPWSTAAAGAIVEYIKENKLDRPVLVGHSLGGHLACRIAAENPGLLQSAVSVDGMPAFPIAGPGVNLTAEQREDMAGRIFQSMSSTPDERWPDQQRAFFMQMVGDPVRGEELVALSLKTPKAVNCRYMAELLASDVTAETKASDTPVLLLAAVPPPGTPGLTPDAVKGWWTPFVDQAKGVQLVFFEETRHFIMDDAPAEFDRAIEQWVVGQPVEGKKAKEPVEEKAEEAPKE